jgi:hypothetical protein
MASPDEPAPELGPETPRTIGQSAMLAAIVVIAVAGFILIGHALRLGPAYAGLLFFWYWAAIDKARFGAMPAALIGSLGGTCTAWLLQIFAHQHNLVGLCAVLIFIVVAIFIQIAELMPIAINIPFMLFLTACGAPLLQERENFPAVLSAIVLSALYFGSIVLAVTSLPRGAGTSGANSAKRKG